MTKDFCKYVDVFYGSGEVDHFAENSLASKWFYIKALCGNTLPHAVLPFGKMSVGAYSSGYPTGYGTHYPNSCGGIKKLWDKMKLRGFSHLHQFGTGAIDYYYNYAVTTPFYGCIENAFNYYDIENESAVPGRYCVDFNDIHCRLTVSGGTAFHSYRFKKHGGRIAIDFSNDGLSRKFEDKFHAYVGSPQVTVISDDTVICEGIFSGIKLFFCAKLLADNPNCRLFEDSKELDEHELKNSDPQKSFGAVFDFDSKTAEVLVSYSTISTDEALRSVTSINGTFDETAQRAYEIWNSYLSRIEISASEEMKKKFYSNLYHSLIKPCDMTGESIAGVSEKCVSDIATFWDQYKTALPLICTFYGEMGRKISDCVINISRTRKRLNCSFGLSTILPCEEQAKMLGIIFLCDAYYAGLADIADIEECTVRELSRDDFRSFIENGTFERYTHILDVCDACLDVAAITSDIDLKARLERLAGALENAYGSDGLLSENSPYYEGDRYTYSFRLHPDMERRIAIAGGQERFIKLLDDFFGFNGESLKPIRDMTDAHIKIANTHYHRFEGFNNEPDMEAPYAYIFADRFDRTRETITEATNVSFGTGRGALPGNNDSGGLSSCFVWNALGLFPMSGTGKFIAGCPQINSARMILSSGNIIELEVSNGADTVSFNGEELYDRMIPTEKLMSGGTIKFTAK